MSTERAGTTRPTSWVQIVAMALGLAVLVGLLVTAFSWPAANTEPRDVPLAVAPAAAMAEVQQRLDQAVPGGFELEPADDAEAARAAIEDRDVYGAIVVEPGGPPRVLIASAASPVVAQLLTQIATQLASVESGTAVEAPIEDVVPLPADDPRGAAFASSALPMAIGGIAVGAAMATVVRGLGRRLVGVLLGALGAGAAVTAVTQSWLGVLEGDWLLNAGVVALTVAAISTTVVGLTALIGPAGIGLGVVATLFLGNPLSGLTSAPEMLPDGWGALGQWLPPGAGGSLLRSTSFFDGAGAGQPLLVLGCWLAAGLLLALLGTAVRARRAGARAGAASAEPTSRDVPAVP